MLWFCYILGSVLTLFFKFILYISQSDKYGKKVTTSAKEWFLELSKENITSWSATIAVVWIAGSLYITQQEFLSLSLPFPQVPSIAFAIGVSMEYVAPTLSKSLIRKISSHFSKGDENVLV